MSAFYRKVVFDIKRLFALIIFKKVKKRRDIMLKHTLKKTLYLLLVTAAVIALFTVYPESAVAVSGKNGKALPIYSVETSEKKLSISFDCAWGVEHTDELLSVMESYGVKCTFFAVKFWVEKYPEYAKKIVEKGHELGTHSATHPHMTKLSAAAIEEELISSSKAIESVTGIKPKLFRCPFGEYDDRVINAARGLGLEVVQWDVDSLDWKDISAAEIASRVISRAKEGSIILCHNNGKYTASALPMILSALKERGFEFVPISELIYSGDYKIDVNGRQIPL